MAIIRQIDTPEQKEHLCNTILRALPSWFGIESSIVEYSHDVRTLPFWAAFDDTGAPVGFVALNVHTASAAEIHVMGILQKCHRQGIGRQFVECCAAFCRAHQIEYMTVKTLADTVCNASYAKTRAFYSSMGFRPLEVFPLLWDEGNPCLYMLKPLGENRQ